MTGPTPQYLDDLIAAQKAEIERLRAALKPFADEHALWKRNGYGGSHIIVRKDDNWIGYSGIQETHLAAAAVAYEQASGQIRVAR